jgi:hypothetical protein
MSKLFEAATKYLQAGLCPIPLWPDRRKNPHLKETKQFNNRLPTVTEWEKWARLWPAANIGLITGYWKNYVCLDFDDQLSYDIWLSTLGTEYHEAEANIVPTWIVTTGRGYHVWYQTKADPGSSRLFIRDGVEVLLRSRGGYCIVPPSVHWTGKPYKTINNLTPFAVSTVADILPGWQEQQQTEHSAPGQRPYLTDTKIRIQDLIKPIKEHPNTRGAYQVWCPFHDDKRKGGTPSAWINTDEQRFGCNKCWPGLWWDVVNVYAMLHDLTNGEAFKLVRRRYARA